MRMMKNTVQAVQWTGWTSDAAGGRHPTYGIAEAPTRFSKQAADSEDVPPHMREQKVTYYKVLFQVDMGLRVRDQLIWVDDGNAILRVTGYSNCAGLFNVWKAICEERPLA